MKSLFDKVQIRTLQLKNRLVRSSTWENLADDKGHMTPELFKVYEDLAKGGVGMILTGYAFVLEEEQPNPGMMGIYDDSFIDEYRRLTEMVHRHDCKIVLQMVYGGSQCVSSPEGRTIWSPSGVEDLATKVVPTAMTKADIDRLIEAFGQAARRAKESGFDGVQLHGAHGYLLSQFMTPHYNRRTDEYGGSLENRARLTLEIVTEVRRQVGADYPLMIKINSEDFLPNGLSRADSLAICRMLDQHGIDAIEVSGGQAASGSCVPPRPKINSRDKEGYHAEAAAAIAAEISATVMVVGGFRTPQVAEEVLAQSQIDLISLSRPLLNDPSLPVRWQNGDREKSSCVSCNQCMKLRPEGCCCVLRVA